MRVFVTISFPVANVAEAQKFTASLPNRDGSLWSADYIYRDTKEDVEKALQGAAIAHWRAIEKGNG